MSNTGKAVVRATEDSEREHEGADSDTDTDVDHDADPDVDYDTDILAALAFNADRTDDSVLWYRYITVRADAKGGALGPRLAIFVATRAAERGYERLRIAVNNPFAYEAMYKAGFAWTGEETGVAELVLERPTVQDSAAPMTPARPRSARATETYQSGLDRYRERDLDDPEVSFLRDRIGSDPPQRIDSKPPQCAEPPARRNPED